MGLFGKHPLAGAYNAVVWVHRPHKGFTAVRGVTLCLTAKFMNMLCKEIMLPYISYFKEDDTIIPQT